MRPFMRVPLYSDLRKETPHAHPHTAARGAGRGACPRQYTPRTALRFDGISSYAAIPDSAAFTVSPMGLTVSVWLRPDARRFSKTEGSLPTEQFVHWLGKGD